MGKGKEQKKANSDRKREKGRKNSGRKVRQTANLITREKKRDKPGKAQLQRAPNSRV